MVAEDKKPTFVYEAEAEKLRAEARRAAAEADLQELQLDSERTIKRELMADDQYHHVYRFNTDVSRQSIEIAMHRMNVWRRVDPGCEITLVFSSPGGEVVSGMAFYDFLQELRGEGHKLTTLAQGMAASMAGILLQAGDIRAIGKESYLLIHQIQAGMMGSWGDLQDRMKWLEKVQERILDIFANRAAEALGKTPAPIRRNIEKNWRRADWWLSSAEALELGFVDEVR